MPSGDLARTPPTFVSVLRDALIDGRLTPSQLADHAHVSVESVDAWLRGRRLPTASSLSKVASALPSSDLALFSSAIALYHERAVDRQPSDKRHRYDQSVSAYLGHAFMALTEQEQRRYSALWETVLQREPRTTRASAENDLSSESLILPEPPIAVVEDWSKIVLSIARQHGALHALPWRKFEDLVAHLLTQYGWEITPMGYTKDDGIDLIAVRRAAPDLRFAMMVQCKRLAEHRKVGVEIVREVWSVRWDRGFHQAMIATTSAFTRGAKLKGEQWDLALRDHDAIVGWCKGIAAHRTA